MRHSGLSMVILVGLLAGNAHANGGGISCSSDSECTSWNYGEWFQCNNHSYCDAGTTVTCTSTYYCGLSCSNGACNNFFHVCDGDCVALAGNCDASTCGGEVCTRGGACGAFCGNGVCDSAANEDCNTCPDDCGGCAGGGGGGGGGGCVSNGFCTVAVEPGCGATSAGFDNCATPCTKTGPVCSGGVPVPPTIPAPQPGPIELMISN